MMAANSWFVEEAYCYTARARLVVATEIAEARQGYSAE